MSKPLVLFTAPVGTRSGYGAHSRDIARSLIAMDRFDVKIFPVRWGSTPQNALNEEDQNDKVIIERLFSYEGLGNMAIDAVINRDLPLIQGIVILFALIFTIVNLLVDLTYTLLNPKLRNG